MARAIERIDRDIASLKEAIKAIAAELQKAYAIYFTLLGQSVRQQLILATYHLCTQGYPEKFLSLSLNQRQHLQQAIRKMGKQTAEHLLTIISSDNGSDTNDISSEPEQQPVSEEDEGEVEDEVDEENENTLKSPLSVLKLADSSNPMELLAWQQSVEKLTHHTIRKLSHDVNAVLQQVSILPKKIPEPILEVAAAASEASAEVMPGPPNLLNVVIEIENEQDAEEPNLTKVMAINLRLGEIEFADPKLSSARKQIRNTLLQLNKLGQDYQRKHRERTIAEAEAAWRAIWNDE
ncbi:hypothetical protein H6G41_01470 [Tolypothrix sp. FACHB-123]|uniref:hypothetical protein n=1 Tax=Tolypothrix sp. FACHB-123 TaxID=2692868 RepID=UPI001682308A|nr:hypothetical protein [Tolypothrix sp. FACHB-123]MBD2353300.1 hypothetical protein [Tolypothrix sp. FACHB-123]